MQNNSHTRAHMPDLHASPEKTGLFSNAGNRFADRPGRFLPASGQPYFSNTVQLNTLDSNLKLAFAFVQEPAQAEEVLKTPAAQVILSNQTAKQLLFTLAELFQCELHPLGAAHASAE